MLEALTGIVESCYRWIEKIEAAFVEVLQRLLPFLFA